MPSLISTVLSTSGQYQSVQPFLQSSQQTVTTTQWTAPFPLIIAPLHGGYGPTSNTWFLGPTQLNIPNDISIGSTIFVVFRVVTDQQTMLLHL